ncbi:MAG: hypothetical protein QOJ69_1226 [Actinomycetota bacterium]|jgi:hypothetical protein|nr:hypothetical protein [Actinomycetota bacterium]
MHVRRLIEVAQETESAAACVEFLLGYYAYGGTIGARAWQASQREWEATVRYLVDSGVATDMQQAELRALRFLVRVAGTEAVFAWM